MYIHESFGIVFDAEFELCMVALLKINKEIKYVHIHTAWLSFKNILYYRQILLHTVHLFLKPN